MVEDAIERIIIQDTERRNEDDIGSESGVDSTCWNVDEMSGVEMLEDDAD